MVLGEQRSILKNDIQIGRLAETCLKKEAEISSLLTIPVLGTMTLVKTLLFVLFFLDASEQHCLHRRRYINAYNNNYY